MWRRSTEDATYTEWEGEEATSEEHSQHLPGMEQRLECSEGRIRNGKQEKNGFTPKRYVTETAKTKQQRQKA